MNVEENTVSLSRPKDNGDEHHVKQLKLGGKIFNIDS